MISGLLLILELVELLLLWLATPALFSPLGAYMSKKASSSSSPPPLNCTSIPYPFGISGKAMKGFEIICNDNSPFLQLGDLATPIENISLSQGYVIISMPLFMGTYNSIPIKWSRLFDLEGTPYMISAAEGMGNVLILIGCGNLAIMQGLGARRNSTSGCISLCNSLDFVIDESCSGLGCCQASIPRGLKGFNLVLNNLGNLTSLGLAFNLNNDVPSSQAYLAKQGSFTFSNKTLRDIIVSIPPNGYPMVLEWAIGNETCEKAMATSACRANSYCYNPTDGVGYRCNCTQGYQGNPYIGCEDIDECQIPELNPCVGLCINEPGTVSCACPSGQRGDGRRQGSGCKRPMVPMVAMELGLGLGLGLLFILIIGGLWSYWFFKKRKLIQIKAKFFQQNGGLFLQQQILSQGSDATAKIFSIEELEKATNNFNESQILGRGGYGTVYKGILSNQKVIAVKKSRLVDGSQIEEFINEIVILSQINHRNVVKLLGCCLETEVPLLVYEFIPNGTLFHLIQGENHNFSMLWEDRLRIAIEIAGALAYLHSAASIPIIHRDIKSTNILLDENYTTKVSDFGASRSVPFDQTHVTTLVQGTFGYLDPEYFYTSQLTDKSDVYSFGVVLVELLTSEIAVSSTRPEDYRSLSTYFRLIFDEGRLFQLIEPRIITDAGMEQLLFVAQLARRCLDLKGEERPTMKEVAMELEGLRKFQKQQMAPQNLKEMEHLIDGAEPANGHIEATRQYTLESDMLASMNLPR